MHHFNAIMQSHQVQNLSTSDTSCAIRGYTNVTDVLAVREVGSFSKMWANLMHLHLCRERACVKCVCVGGGGEGGVMSGKVWD